MPSMVEQTCRCGEKFMARVADVKRGWGKSCSKSCAASLSNKKTGNYQRFKNKQRKAIRREEMSDDDYYYSTTHPFSSGALGQD